MVTRHSFAAAALLVTTFSAQADVVSVASAPTLNGASGFYLLRGVEGLYMVASRTISQTADLQPTIAPAPALLDLQPTIAPAPALIDTGAVIVAAPVVAEVAADIIAAPVVTDTAADAIPVSNAGGVIPDTPILIGTIAPLAPLEADADPIVNATEVPEPSSIALLLAGILGAAGFTRARKQS